MIDIQGYKYNGALTKKQVDNLISNYDKVSNNKLYENFEPYDLLTAKYLLKELVKRGILKPKKEAFKCDIQVRKEKIDKYVLDNYKEMSMLEMAKNNDVTPDSIYSRVRKFKLEGSIGKEYFPTVEKIDFTKIDALVLTDYNNRCAKELALELGVNIKQVYVSASRFIQANILTSKVIKKGDVINDRLKSAQ